MGKLLSKQRAGARKLGLRSAGSKIVHRPKTPRPNIRRKKRQIKKELKDDDTISVHPPDKGRVTVVWDRVEYLQKMDALVSNTDTYEELAADLTQQYRALIMAALLPMKSYLPLPLFHRLSPSTTANPPLMFGQPKVHKQGMPLRPIVTCANSIFQPLAHILGRIL